MKYVSYNVLLARCCAENGACGSPGLEEMKAINVIRYKGTSLSSLINTFVTSTQYGSEEQPEELRIITLAAPLLVLHLLPRGM